MKMMSPNQRFWIAVLVIGGYLAFGATATFAPARVDAHIFVTTVLATMGPLVGWVIKDLFVPVDMVPGQPTPPVISAQPPTISAPPLGRIDPGIPRVPPPLPPGSPPPPPPSK